MQCSNKLLSRKLAEADKREGEKRKEAWQRIQAEAPELAQFMTYFNRVFGKPAKVSVEIRGEKVI